MSLRDDIATYTFEALAATDEEMSHPELMRASTRMTNRILEMIREALLSDEAVEAGSMGRWSNPEAFRFGSYAYREGWNDDTRKTITAALDAITGKDEE